MTVCFTSDVTRKLQWPLSIGPKNLLVRKTILSFSIANFYFSNLILWHFKMNKNRINKNNFSLQRSNVWNSVKHQPVSLSTVSTIAFWNARIDDEQWWANKHWAKKKKIEQKKKKNHRWRSCHWRKMGCLCSFLSKLHNILCWLDTHMCHVQGILRLYITCFIHSIIIVLFMCQKIL